MRPTVRRFFGKMLGHGHVLVALGAGFFIGCGLLMQHNGVHDFHYVGGRYAGGRQPQSGTPEMLLWLGGIMLALDSISALLFRADQLKRERAETGTGNTLLP